MIFTRRFFILLAIGALPLAFVWTMPALKYGMIAYDLLLFALAWIDARRAEKPEAFTIERHLPHRLMIGAENEVVITLRHQCPRRLSFILKDEYPPALELRGERIFQLTPIRQRSSDGMPVSKMREATARYHLYASVRGDYEFGDLVIRYDAPWGLVTKQARIPAAEHVKVYPNLHEARKYELQARHNRQLLMGLRRTRLRGQGREFESLRDYVRGDELRHISWTATARRGRMTTRQYQTERNQSIVVMLDAGRLMTSRPASDNEHLAKLSKLDHAINATLAIAYVAASGGDNIGLLVFNRQVASYLPPQRGHAQLNAMIEALYNVKPQMAEPSYARAFQYLSNNCKRRSLVVILTDLVDSEASAELLSYTATLLPRHLPLIVTIGDNDLRALVTQPPADISAVYQQSVAEELVQQ
ncbi:MAG: DUF58 domain-containing protein, partial [Acidobacteria bacterium]|nr:DUF58 domain-containing protein [Acidobacteriota bacterium]